ncbi:aminotransferase class I/II-fold pyridoxal phosphate-dependent enzyme [Gracilibacillus oryzae]|uniref:Aminotransferase class I/II-fold pyridoxal phosphate-dependent enzyme n=1 Tax=Gracilibacillus oryzae TaxID=1672701 RepID=A0A7C8GR38_9BACI|nr:aminotransferase class I/II-fold pyridoxal phosphate-dependent enzyme [Gracilibacillus oryzae]KAB8126535.1 aminotransferase class I/II-fold pyridoxal phosphate-dependent enzyme [Gracilibacillus oryzae]
MSNNQIKTPLLDKVMEHTKKSPVSLHVPGHKNGQVLDPKGYHFFKEVTKLDLTEISGLDDLHAPDGVIKQAQGLAAEWFQTEETFFLVNGSTVGNLAMILATCEAGDLALVQRNCHKSILNGLELAGARPIFLEPNYSEQTNRYENPSVETIETICRNYPDAKTIILTYPDYFGKTYELEKIIRIAHQYNMVVLIDEAHGCHFSVPFFQIKSSVRLGADVVVQSAHKMTPALTMGAYLHIPEDSKVNKQKIIHYLSILQSSSPSYLIMISLDIARHYLANYTWEKYLVMRDYMGDVRNTLHSNEWWKLERVEDPLKLVIKALPRVSADDIFHHFETENIYAELKTNHDILFIFGMEPTIPLAELQTAVENVKVKLQNSSKWTEKHDKINDNIKNNIYKTGALSFSYHEMKKKKVKWVKLDESVGCVASEAVIPYPPGIPLIAKGEKITREHVEWIKQLRTNDISFHPSKEMSGLFVFD